MSDIRDLSWVTETPLAGSGQAGGGVKDPGPIHICGSKTSSQTKRQTARFPGEAAKTGPTSGGGFAYK